MTEKRIEHFHLIDDADAELRSIVMKHASVRFGYPLLDKIINRIEFELNMIKNRKNADLVLLMRELMIRYIKSNYPFKFCGMGNNSFVGYILDLERINPLQYNLLFEKNNKNMIFPLLIPYEKKNDFLWLLHCMRGVSDVICEVCAEKFSNPKAKECACFCSKIYLIPEVDREREDNGSLLPKVSLDEQECICGIMGDLKDYFRVLYVNFYKDFDC